MSAYPQHWHVLVLRFLSVYSAMSSREGCSSPPFLCVKREAIPTLPLNTLEPWAAKANETLQTHKWTECSGSEGESESSGAVGRSLFDRTKERIRPPGTRQARRGAWATRQKKLDE